jgi:hypothetical protein
MGQLGRRAHVTQHVKVFTLISRPNALPGQMVLQYACLSVLILGYQLQMDSGACVLAALPQ